MAKYESYFAASQRSSGMRQDGKAKGYDGPYLGYAKHSKDKDVKEWGESEHGKDNPMSYNAFRGKKREEAKKAKEQRLSGMESQISSLQSQLNKQKSAKAKSAPKPKGDQQIDPVQHSPEISGAQKIANSYMDSLKNQKSPWEQSQNDANSSSNFGNFNPGGEKSSTPDAQDFADKYKLDLISSGATKQNNTDFTSGGESHMTSADILKRDRQMYGT